MLQFRLKKLGNIEGSGAEGEVKESLEVDGDREKNEERWDKEEYVALCRYLQKLFGFLLPLGSR